MVINANTKIGSIIREKADALEAIISISPKFEKLRNPVLRKLIAARTSIAAASRIGNCQVADFFNKLRPLGFEIDEHVKAGLHVKKDLPAFLLNLEKNQLTELDVRPVILAGHDPLGLIMQKVKGMIPGQVLKIINTFYPEPLILLLEKRGFESFVAIVDDNLVEAYFCQKDAKPSPVVQKLEEVSGDWQDILLRYGGKLQTIDVRELEMPKPMMTILESLESLPEETALYVYHKRIPVFLLPELKERGFNFRSRQVREGEIHLLIFRN
ncbi:MAG TPA: DUF2249 domain-containing protein [Chitinophagaceae bacterium]|nr:DUF2249 domain-containing protein [Chitinophagaceae bacterium]